MKIYFRLLQYAKPIQKYIVPYVLFSILGVIFGLLNFTLLIPVFDILFNNEAVQIVVKPVFSFSVQYFKDQFYYSLQEIIAQHGKVGALYFVCIILVSTVMLSNLFKYLSQRIMENWRIHIVMELRSAIFDKIMHLHLGYFSDQRKGDLIARVTSDVSTIQGSITNSLVVFFKEPLTLIGYFAVLFSMSTQLTLFTILIIPVSGIIISRLVKKLKRYANNAQVYFGNMISLLDESLGGIRVVKAFNAIEYVKDRLKHQNYEYSKNQRRIVARQQLASPISEFLGITTIAVILIYGGALVMEQQSALSASTFIAYIILFSQVLGPAKSLTNSLGDIQHGIVSGTRVFELLDVPLGVKDKPDAIVIKEFTNELKFQNVHFSYGDKQVLKGVDLTLTKGKTIALVGPSGGGKTTISDLIPRFYDPEEGVITIDGLDIRECTQESVRALMGVVNQEAILFNDTIANNIAFGMPNATPADIEQAARVANAHQFICESENGYDTIIGDRGNKLSGGQKQRLSIARAVLRNPPILLLDEATSALDTESERLVQDALTNLMKNRTTLVIAHRLSTIQHADEILVVQKGKIIERGSHTDLLGNPDGLYHRLLRMQELQHKTE